MRIYSLDSTSTGSNKRSDTSKICWRYVRSVPGGYNNVMCPIWATAKNNTGVISTSFQGFNNFHKFITEPCEDNWICLDRFEFDQCWRDQILYQSLAVWLIQDVTVQILNRVLSVSSSPTENQREPFISF